LPQFRQAKGFAVGGGITTGNGVIMNSNMVPNKRVAKRR